MILWTNVFQKIWDDMSRKFVEFAIQPVSDANGVLSKDSFFSIVMTDFRTAQSTLHCVELPQLFLTLGDLFNNDNNEGLEAFDLWLTHVRVEDKDVVGIEKGYRLRIT